MEEKNLRNNFVTKGNFAFRTLFIIIYLAAGGLGYLYLKNQIYASGSRRKKLESQMQSTTVQNRDLDWQIESLTSHTLLQQRVRDGFIKMTEIPDNTVIRIRLFPDATGSQAIPAVSSGPSSRESLKPVENRFNAD